jgi:hypothetical protein
MIKLKVDTKPVINWLEQCMTINEDVINKIVEDCIFGMKTGDNMDCKYQIENETLKRENEDLKAQLAYIKGSWGYQYEKTNKELIKKQDVIITQLTDFIVKNYPDNKMGVD